MPVKESTPAGFNEPTLLPASDAQRREWQERNRQWWEHNPMRYDWNASVGYPEFSPGFYEEIDKRFFSDAKRYLPWNHIPFDQLIDFAALAQQEVLEIGVGSGSHAQLLATHAKRYTGIDLTDYAVQSTSKRMECFGLRANILRMDAEQLEFPAESFDFVWSWGVIHHSSHTGKILEEMHRVLRPGGKAVTMVYYRNLWNYYVVAGLLHGVMRGELLKTRSLHQILQNHNDGAIARHYSIPEWEALVSKHFHVESCRIMGGKAEIVPLPASQLKDQVIDLIPDALSAFMTNDCRMGSMLVTTMTKK